MTPFDQEKHVVDALKTMIRTSSQSVGDIDAQAQKLAIFALEILQALENLHPSYFHTTQLTLTGGVNLKTPSPSRRILNPAYPHVHTLSWKAAQAVYLFVQLITLKLGEFQMDASFDLEQFEQVLEDTRSFVQELVTEHLPANRSADQKAREIARRLDHATGVCAWKKVSIQDAVIQLAGLNSECEETLDAVCVIQRDVSSALVVKGDCKIRVIFEHEDAP